MPTRDKISRYKQDIELHSSFCKNSIETVNHLFMECTFARAIWMGMDVNISAIIHNFTTFHNWVKTWFTSNDMHLNDSFMDHERNICI